MRGYGIWMVSWSSSYFWTPTKTPTTTALTTQSHPYIVGVVSDILGDVIVVVGIVDADGLVVGVASWTNTNYSNNNSNNNPNDSFFSNNQSIQILL